MIMDQMGGDKFKKLHTYLSDARKKGIDDTIIDKGMKKILGDDVASLKLANQLDQIVFYEQLYAK